MARKPTRESTSEAADPPQAVGNAAPADELDSQRDLYKQNQDRDRQQQEWRQKFLRINFKIGTFFETRNAFRVCKVPGPERDCLRAELVDAMLAADHQIRAEGLGDRLDNYAKELEKSNVATQAAARKCFALCKQQNRPAVLEYVGELTYEVPDDYQAGVFMAMSEILDLFVTRSLPTKPARVGERGSPSDPAQSKSDAARAANGYFHVDGDVVHFRTATGWSKYAFGAATMRLFEMLNGKQEVSFAKFIIAFGRAEEQYHPYQQDANELLARKDAIFHFEADKRTDSIFIVDGSFAKKSRPRRVRKNTRKKPSKS